LDACPVDLGGVARVLQAQRYGAGKERREYDPEVGEHEVQEVELYQQWGVLDELGEEADGPRDDLEGHHPQHGEDESQYQRYREADDGGLQRHPQSAQQDGQDRDGEVEVRAGVPFDSEEHQPCARSCAMPTRLAMTRSSQRMPARKIIANTK